MLRANKDWKYCGLQVVLLENRYLRVAILPEVGGKIWQITYKPADADLLWNNPRIPPAKQLINARYDDVWSGGWDELFPNDEVSQIVGDSYPDHGEFWTGAWRAATFEEKDAVGVTLSYSTPISAVRATKTITLRRDERRLRFSHSFTNLGASDFPFLWKLHPAFAVTPQHRIDFPPMRVLLEPAFRGTLEGAEPEFAWPYARIGKQKVDLRCIPPASAQQLYFFYGTGLTRGWCALTDTNARLASVVTFDPRLLSSCWLFASYGGWRNYNVAVLEPCTGYPLSFAKMMEAGRHRTLRAGETLETETAFSVKEGLRSVGGIGPDGEPFEAEN
ncbi:MAG: DUF5107 domain-containing protein [Acidobacteria bacterium]|nr:DUF5107 domain-containing protein [Acidobacteriota bacterium]MBS1866319.1 DUF5107 domain-containing protein [Acidobacteriota bacterium]